MTINMTIKQLIDKVAEEKPNTFGNDKLTGYINEIEADVAEQLRATFTPYVYETDKNKPLIVKSPYDRLYVSYLKAMIDYANEEYESYSNNQAQHVQDFRDYIDYVVRESAADNDNVIRRFKNTFY